MSSIVRFGTDSAVELEFADGALVAECGVPRARALDAPAQAVARALAEPLDYPPLGKSTTPGDRVVVVLGHDVPQAAEVVGGLIRYLADNGVAPDGIGVLRSGGDLEAGGAELLRELPPDWQQRIALLIHDPADRGRLAYLAATSAGEPILLNRAIIDADVVLPVGCAGPRSGPGRFSVHGLIYPAFSDEQTLLRFRAAQPVEAAGGPRRRVIEEVNEVGWLLGVTFAVQVVPGPGDRILHVLAGEVEAVARRSRELYRQAWSWSVPRRASLVLATMEGGFGQQTWHNFAQCVAAAVPLVEEGGAIAVCSSLSAEPGPGIRRLVGARSRQAALRQVQKEKLEDARQAAQLAQALEWARVYLLSGLDHELLEELEIAPIADAAELARLVARHETCILLANAHLSMVSVAAED